ncbi:hypothetical protein ACFXK0_19025 [Nocardia sp. NPDC059177]|uniref:hypothetical protein n=1 Tax=Nocardia sp. NPDC059177 TaxID=3346759 RepID=UPI0036A38EB7
MGTEGDENDFGDFGPPVDDVTTSFGGPLAATPPPAPGALPERGWQPAAAPPAAPGPFGPPAGAAGPFGAPVSGPPPVAPPPNQPAAPPGPPVAPPRGPVPPRSQSAPTSVFGDAVATPPPGGRDASPFGDSVPVASGGEMTEVIRRERPPRRDPEPDIVRAPETVRVPAPETTRAPLPAAERKDDDKAWWNSPDDDGGVPKPPAEPGLSWADDPIARRLAPKSPVAPVSEQKETQNRLPWIIGGTVAAVVIVVALVTTISLVKRGGDDPGTTAAPTTSAVIPGFECQAVSEQGLTVGNGPGDTSSGPRAILGFQYAFYVERSGVKVREFASPEGDISQADRLQRAIDGKIPVGAKHCVQIRETGPDRFDVDLTEWHPDGTQITYPQVIMTTTIDGKWQVKHIFTR